MPLLVYRAAQLAVLYLNMGKDTAKKDSEVLMSASLFALPGQHNRAHTGKSRAGSQVGVAAGYELRHLFAVCLGHANALSTSQTCQTLYEILPILILDNKLVIDNIINFNCN